MDQWKDMTIDERMQRDINGTGVAADLVPYIIKDPDWLFGSLINMAAYKDAGFLTLEVPPKS